jgi:hypothetical protein
VAAGAPLFVAGLLALVNLGPLPLPLPLPLPRVR